MTRLKTRFGQFLEWCRRDGKMSFGVGRFGKGKGKTSKQWTPRDPASEAGGATGKAAGPTATATATAQEVAVRKPPKETAVDKLQKGYEEVVELMGNVKSHMEQQSQRSQRLIEILEGLPEALRSLPEANRNQTRTLQAIQQTLGEQSKHNGRLADALTGLAKTNENHSRAMAAIGNQLDASQQNSEQMRDSFNTLGGTLGRMSASNEASTSLLRQIADQESKAADQVRQLFVRNQKHMTTMSVVSWSLAIVALTVAGYVAVSVSRLAPGPAEATPAANTDVDKQQNEPVIQPTSAKADGSATIKPTNDAEAGADASATLNTPAKRDASLSLFAPADAPSRSATADAASTEPAAAAAASSPQIVEPLIPFGAFGPAASIATRQAFEESLYTDLPGVIARPATPRTDRTPGFSLVPELAGEE